MGLEYSDLDLPAKPGVYIFKRDDDRVTYIGKATDLRLSLIHISEPTRTLYI